MIPTSGPIENLSTLMVERLGLIMRRLSCPPTGTRPSLRSVSEWKSANKSTLLLSTSKQILSTHWSLMEDTAPPHWVVTRGGLWLVLRLHYRVAVTKKGSMLLVPGQNIPKQGSVLLETIKTTVRLVTQG